MKFDYYNSRKKEALIKDVRELLTDIQNGDISKKQAGETMAYILKVDDTDILGKFSDDGEFTVSYLMNKKIGAKRSALLKDIIMNYSVSKDTEAVTEEAAEQMRQELEEQHPFSTKPPVFELDPFGSDYREGVEVVGQVEESSNIVVDAEFKEIE